MYRVSTNIQVQWFKGFSFKQTRRRDHALRKSTTASVWQIGLHHVTSANEDTIHYRYVKARIKVRFRESLTATFAAIVKCYELAGTTILHIKLIKRFGVIILINIIYCLIL